MKPKIDFEMPASKVKEAAKGALQYALTNMLTEFQYKFNMCIDAIEIRHGFVQVSMHETASGIRTNEEVAQAIRDAADRQLNSISQQLANNN